MMQGKILSLAGLCAAALVAAAERSGAQDGAPGVPGTYTLVHVEGRPLPTVVETDGACRDELVSGTLTLADGAWTLQTVERELCEGRTPAEDRETDGGRYTVSGQTVTFSVDEADGDDAPGADAQSASPGTEVDVEEPASGTVDGGTLTVRLRGGQTVVFRR